MQKLFHTFHIGIPHSLKRKLVYSEFKYMYVATLYGKQHVMAGNPEDRE